MTTLDDAVDKHKSGQDWETGSAAQGSLWQQHSNMARASTGHRAPLVVPVARVFFTHPNDNS